MDNNMQDFLVIWNKYMIMAVQAFLVVGVLIFLYHMVKLLTTRDYKSKYDYINLNEINYLWYSILAIIIGGVVYANTLFIESTPLWFFVRIFVSVSMGMIVGVLFLNSLKFYYPFHVEKRLKKLRYTPRISPKSGKPMKLMSEDEEDVYLDEGMQAEEDVFSVDYDVWLDEETGFTKIEKYAGHLHALECTECNYLTYKVVREEVLISPTTTQEGELDKHYKCTYCSHKGRKTFKIAQLTETGESLAMGNS